MLALATLFALLQLASVRANPSPLEPSSTSVFNEGGQCTIQWTADPTGAWKVMNIELMTGSNQNMVHLHTVGTVDGTSTTNNSYSYPCLAVDPNSQIYFYQFSSPGAPDLLWTTRFTIADANGTSVPPPLQETTASGEIIRYGIGKLEDQSLVDSPPPHGTNVNMTSLSSVPGTGTTTPTATNALATPTATPTRNVSINDDSDSDTNSPTSSTATPPQSQIGGAVSTQPSSVVAILALAILGRSLFL